ncbi:hypothetical protein MNEG_1733 [Monoraphidium neglectum]|jgi:hypothetical protein|uniref:Glycine zipper domain-containing protein n=1 Tax=Monoraphidium neglectum TaxID=145388 RepID=A0A0D2NP79_9CHLO|nr:hypothetical protein MNEG_1733 [Monoraphidium neglectum]KIZ06221.1 hypothetical protein MNEG_1733 [Monoraphidium neglectum]|eukprot:XP_013905240.1 hypothetical protein MNEG_1733 [Monoraphidium neglectum]
MADHPDDSKPSTAHVTEEERPHVAKAAAAAAAVGATVGALGGPLGAGLGAGVGAGVGATLGKLAEKEQVEEAGPEAEVVKPGRAAEEVRHLHEELSGVEEVKQ